MDGFIGFRVNNGVGAEFLGVRGIEFDLGRYQWFRDV